MRVLLALALLLGTLVLGHQQDPTADALLPVLSCDVQCDTDARCEEQEERCS